MQGEIVGRADELAAVERLLGESGPAGLVLEGGAGIGKTTVWAAALPAARGRGRRLLVARGVGAEVRLAYTGLTDLLAGVEDGELERLPDPQRRALAAALLRDSDRSGPPDPRAIATGLRSTLELLSAAAPLLLAVDDFQWLDPSSAEALRFALRRLDGDVAVLLTAREEPDGAALVFELREPGRLQTLSMAPLAATDLHRVLVGRVDRPLSPPLLNRIVEASGGNPFTALELARVAEREDALAPLTRMPSSLREIVDARLAALDDAARAAVLYAALLTRPDVPRVTRALGGDDAEGPLAAAEQAGVLHLDGARIVFSHPLLATGAYSALSAAQRRAAHRVIAGVTEGEEQARHLALSSVSAEPAVVEALDTAAAQARERGSAAAAAELLELALRLGATMPERRRLAAAHHLDAGEVGRAGELLEGLVAELPAGDSRADALAQLATIRRLADELPSAVALLEEAIEECEDQRRHIEAALDLTFCLTQTGGLREAVPLVGSALARAERLGEPDLLARALAVDTMARFLAGRGADEAQLQRALRLEDPERAGPVMLQPSLIAGQIWVWTGRYEEAHAAIERARRGCRDRGEESDLAFATMHCGQLACLRGDLAGGRELVEDGLRRAEQIGSPTSRVFALENQVQVAGWAGEVELARRAAAEAIAICESSGMPVGGVIVSAALGLVELSLGDYTAAAELLLPAAEGAVGFGAGDPGVLYWTADAIEALAALDRLADAEPIRDWQLRRSESIGRPGLLAVAARVDGAVLAARGDLAEAEAALGDALEHHKRAPSTYESARTLLVLGQVQRRRRRRAAARASLTLARERFAELEARLWEQRVEGELERLDGRRVGGNELTPSESRVAALAAAGLTNRAAAAELFISPKTVEATLSRVYRKLGINSRAELGRWMAQRERAAASSPPPAP